MGVDGGQEGSCCKHVRPPGMHTQRARTHVSGPLRPTPALLSAGEGVQTCGEEQGEGGGEWGWRSAFHAAFGAYRAGRWMGRRAHAGWAD